MADGQPAVSGWKRKRLGLETWAWATIGGIVGGVALLALLAQVTGYSDRVAEDRARDERVDAQEESDRLAQDNAVVLCEQAVTERLRSPGTADFASNDPRVRAGGGYTVQGFVDSENGFGALLRSNYECQIARGTGAAVTLESVTVQE